ncbi:hypothetical protein OHT57_02855 [Streptomyces sp. NBC_00285]|uniref:hypothetical protein n=1 Tax=Streptomyces sp. NBC_00285 TaxID=2975700 RepID=UPI002E29F9D1|nr:hypothetical protein [Streptomyces sp. NBC_00285]
MTWAGAPTIRSVRPPAQFSLRQNPMLHGDRCASPPPTRTGTTTAVTEPDRDARDAALRELKAFHVAFRACPTHWGDDLFDIADAVLCGADPVRHLADLRLAAEHTRACCSVQGAINYARIDFERLNRFFELRDLPPDPGDGIVLAVCVAHWLRPDANTGGHRQHRPCRRQGRFLYGRWPGQVAGRQRPIGVLYTK